MWNYEKNTLFNNTPWREWLEYCHQSHHTFRKIQACLQIIGFNKASLRLQAIKVKRQHRDFDNWMAEIEKFKINGGLRGKMGNL